MARKKEDSWKQNEIQILKKYYRNFSKKRILKLLPNRNWKGIQIKTSRLGLKRNTKGFWKGKNNPFYGKHHTKKTRMRMKISRLKRRDELGYINSPEARRKMGLTRTGEGNPMYGKKQSQRTKHLIIKKLSRRPTNLEKMFIIFCNKYKLPFNYVGNRKLFIGRRNPDFIHNNRKKLLIEVAYKREKSIKRERRIFNSWKEYKKQRYRYFSKFGFKTLFVWNEDFNNEIKLLEKVRGFMNGRKN